MKRYLAALIPFVVCSLISLLFYYSEPKDYPDPSYPYITPEYMIYFTNRWLWIGVVVSALFLIVLALEDIFDFMDKRRQKKYFR